MIKGIRYYVNYHEHRKLFRDAGINDGDFFLTSFPKSGNTWLRFILARSLYNENAVDLRTLSTYFPTAYKSSAEEIRNLSAPRFIKTHSAFFSLYPKTIYIYRDYRAVAVSAYFHAKKNAGYAGTLKEFLASPLLQTFGPWFWHVNAAIEWKEKHPDRILLLSYEEMLAEPQAVISRVHEFTGIKPIIPLEEIAAKTEFQSLASQEIELKQKGATDSNQPFFRSGNSDDWKNYLDEEDLQLILDLPTTETMKRCGYLMK